MTSSSSSSPQSSHLQSIVDSLPPEIISTIAASLDSQRLVLARRVCPKWLDTIDADRSLFKTLDLSSSTIRQWNNGILQLFDRRSRSKLVKVILPFRRQVQGEDLYEFVWALRKSASTLSSLSFSVNLSGETTLECGKGNCLFPLLRGVLTSLLHGPSFKLSILCISGSNRGGSPALQVFNQRKSQSPLDRADHLTYLSLSGFCLLDTLILSMTVLESPAKLEYLHLSAPREWGLTWSRPVQFNHLKVLELSFRLQEVFEIYYLPNAFPKVKLIIQDIRNLKALSRLPPSTQEWWIRVDVEPRYDSFYEDLTPLFDSGPRVRNLKIDMDLFGSKQNDMVQALEKRFALVGSEINGEQMRPLEKLIISKKHFEKTLVSRLEGVVGEVIDVKDAPDRLQISIPESSDRVSNAKSLLCSDSNNLQATPILSDNFSFLAISGCV